jgi:hypothetical protein
MTVSTRTVLLLCVVACLALFVCSVDAISPVHRLNRADGRGRQSGGRGAAGGTTTSGGGASGGRGGQSGGQTPPKQGQRGGPAGGSFGGGHSAGGVGANAASGTWSANKSMKDKFVTLTQLVIDNFEGGYYHPDMSKTWTEANRKIYAKRGETMFGLDRLAGAGLARYPEWNQFWGIIDRDRAANPTKWKWLYKGGAVNAPLKALAAKVMYQSFDRLSKKFLSPAAMEKINKDNRLLVHFSYACWNGPGFFQKFATVLESANGSREEIYNKTLSARTQHSNKQIRNGGRKMTALFASPQFHTYL